MVHAHPPTQSNASRGLPPGTPFPLLTLSKPQFSVQSSPEPVPPESSSPVYLPPAGPETPVRHNLPKLMTTKLFYIPEQPVRRNLFGNHLHGCPYNDAHLLGMADHPTPPLSKRRSRLECNCAKLLEEGFDQERDNTRKMDGSVGRGKVLDGKVCATLSWSSSPIKGGDDDDDEMGDEQQYPPTSPLLERPRSAAPSPYSSTGEGEPKYITFDAEPFDDEMSDADVEYPDTYMHKLTLHTESLSRAATFTSITADESSEGKIGPGLDDDCDTICDTEYDAEYDTEMETEPQAGYNHQGQDDTEDDCTVYEGDDGGDSGFFAVERGQQLGLDNQKALATLTGGPRKAIWYPAEVLAQENHILIEN